MAGLVDRLIALGLMSLGLVLMVTPLALWVAWTKTIYLVVLATGIAAGVLYCILVGFERSAEHSQTSDHAGTRSFLDKIIDELQSLHPFIHHNGPRCGSHQFRTAMYHLKTHLYRRPD